MDEFHLPLRVEVDPSKNLNDLLAERVAQHARRRRSSSTSRSRTARGSR